MTQWIDADRVANLLKPGMTVFVAGATSEPGSILDALRRNPGCCADVHFVSVSIPGVNKVDFSSLHDDCESTAFFATKENRDAIAAKSVDFLPMQYRSIFDYLSEGQHFDVVLAQLPVPKNDENFSLGLCADFLPAVLDKAALFVAEFNAQQPLPDDSPAWPAARLDYAVRSDQHLPQIPVAPVDAAAADIGRQVTEIIQDGDCLQIGIGGIPNAILAELRNKNDLGVHSGLVSDGIMDLAISGNITGSRKNIDNGQIVTGTTLGSRKLLDWAGSDPSLMFRPVSYTHDAGNIRQLEQFVSINSALQIDLFGQINSDMLNGKQMSGTGGAIDMIRGAAMSKGGRSIIALKATAEGGKTSRIIPRLCRDTATTILRTDVDYIVTEFGARRLRHLSAADRVNALIELAAPQFRDQLQDDWGNPA